MTKGYSANTSEWQKIKANIIKAQSKVAQIGFFEGSYYGPENDNLPVATVAMWNEEGDGIPMRSFIRAGFIQTLKRSGKFKAQVTDMFALVAEGKMTMEQFVASIGPELVLAMREEIIKFNDPRNSPYTIAEKGKDDPLRDSDTMLNSVAFKSGIKGG